MAPPSAQVRPGQWPRVAWGWLTSMRTALVLLFLLALAAIPGSLVPQRPQSAFKVSEFVKRNPGLGRFYDAVGLFDVYAAPWFAAIYLLLFISLIGCIVPRWSAWVRSLRTPPPRTPTNLSRLPGYLAVPLGDVAADEALSRAAAWLRRRFVVEERPANGPRVASVAAERGRLRELGNLVFHTSLVFVLGGVAVAGLWGYKGSALVVEGSGFSNTLTQYDEFTAGGRFDERQLAPFTVNVDEFRVTFERGDVNTGAPRSFEADVTVSDSRGSRHGVIGVNRPMVVDGDSIHLIAHGYAANVTVRDGDGNVAWSGPAPFLPQDKNFTSAGAIKAPDARPERLAFEGLFLPTAVVDAQGPHSIFPDALNPALFLNAWAGPPKQETGRPENVYSLDRTGLTQVTVDGRPLAVQLKQGETLELPDGRGSLTFNGYQRWVRLQVSRSPGTGVALVSVLVAVAGLCASLFVRPRRVWARVVDVDGVPTLEVGGLDKVEARAGLEEDLAGAVAAGLGRDAEDFLPDDVDRWPGERGADESKPGTKGADDISSTGSDHPAGTDPRESADPEDRP